MHNQKKIRRSGGNKREVLVPVEFDEILVSLKI
jgi:hypothetical protein